ncbi:hypothetical protein AB0P13_23190 [Rhodococcus pyridinivorans]|uniref:hypothetical protein n=1 Tax=Rhodococcus TaxID=1827 RepID=UPI000934AB90|nr:MULTISPECIES: hypothetical protein [Rhodococcus]MBD8056426.1 hypothetical protein [Rhodococcus ruber]WKK14691.1 hypothetical protein QYN14_26345 [Rhodococcus ruber]
MKLSLPEPDLAPAGEQWRQMIRDEQQQWLDERGVSLSDDQRKLAFYQAAVAVGELRERVAQLPAEQVRGEALDAVSRYAPRSRWWWVQHAAVVLAFVAVIGWFYFNQDTVVLWEYVPAGETADLVAQAVGYGRWATWTAMVAVLVFVLGLAAVMWFGKSPLFKEKAIQYWRTALGMALCALCTGVFVLACTIYAFYTDLA